MASTPTPDSSDLESIPGILDHYSSGDAPELDGQALGPQYTLDATNLDFPGILAAPNFRQLSATRIFNQSSTGAAISQTILLYENTNGYVTATVGEVQIYYDEGFQGNTRFWNWLGFDSIVPNNTYTYPFTSYISSDTDQTILILNESLSFPIGLNARNPRVNIESNDSNTEPVEVISMFPLVTMSDIAVIAPNTNYSFVAQINDSKLTFIQGLGEMADASKPPSLFPSARLSSLTTANSTINYVYHQLDGSNFAEEQWDASNSAWMPAKNMSISFG
ncbi:MAG: hypothetical protein Q9167_003585 [Letrouitia subvulpina]